MLVESLTFMGHCTDKFKYKFQTALHYPEVKISVANNYSSFIQMTHGIFNAFRYVFGTLN